MLSIFRENKSKVQCFADWESEEVETCGGDEAEDCQNK